MIENRRHRRRILRFLTKRFCLCYTIYNHTLYYAVMITYTHIIALEEYSARRRWKDKEGYATRGIRRASALCRTQILLHLTSTEKRRSSHVGDKFHRNHACDCEPNLFHFLFMQFNDVWRCCAICFTLHSFTCFV